MRFPLASIFPPSIEEYIPVFIDKKQRYEELLVMSMRIDLYERDERGKSTSTFQKQEQGFFRTSARKPRSIVCNRRNKQYTTAV